MKIIHKDVSELTEVEYRACYAANYGAGGYMRPELIDCRDRRVDLTGRVIMLWDGPKDTTASLKAWALLTPVRVWGTVAGTYWNKKKAIYTAQFWVKSRQRKKGYGTLLMNEVIKLDPCPHVFPHNTRSGEFFSKYKVTGNIWDNEWIKRANQKKRRAA